MGIIRVQHDRERPYVCISRDVLQNAALSFEARGLLAYLLSKPDGWEVNSLALSRESPNARTDRVTRIMNELMRAGHLIRRRERGEGGHWVWLSVVLESPLPEHERQTSALHRPEDEDAAAPEQAGPEMEDRPQWENPSLENPALENPGLYIVEIPQSTEVRTPLPPKGGAEEAATPKKKRGEKPVHPDFARARSLIGLWCYGDPEMRLATKGTHINTSKAVNELLALHGSADELQRLYAAVRRDPFWGGQKTISPKKLGELFANPDLKPRVPTPTLDTPLASQEAPQGPAQESAALRATQALADLSAALSAPGASLASVARTPLRARIAVAYHHPLTHAAFVALIDEESLGKLRDAWGEPRMAW